jgi:predicted nucleic acid-binding protein
MVRYVLDTRLYIAAIRNREKARELAEFSAAFIPFLYLSAIVVQEVLAGATDEARRREVERHLFGPLLRVGRLITPSFGAWREAGRVLGDLRAQGVRTDQARASFTNDVLLATSCREHGYTLVTDNRADFDLIATVLEIEHVPPWPTG